MSEIYYYNKYIKYKTKYLQLTEQNAGNYKTNDNILDTNRCIEDSTGMFTNLSDCVNNNLWKDNYIELYNILLNIVSNDKLTKISELSEQNNIPNSILKKIQSLCILLIENLTLIYTDSTNSVDKRIINYNMRFIINIISMLTNETFVSSIDRVQFNKEQPLDKNQFYYLEDAFTNDLKLFFTEYDKLVKEKKSIFFYRSNLVNISILLKCFSDRCIEQISAEFPQTKSTKFYNNLLSQLTPTDFELIFKNFTMCKKYMIKLLLEAYKDFSHEKVKKVYINYLKFHHENFKNLKLVVSEKDKLDESFQRLNKIIENSGTNYFIYLSCNLASEFKFQKFEMTRILISYLGFRENNDDFYNSIDIIEHDFGDIHDQYKRKISYTDSELLELRSFLFLLYDSFKSDKSMFEKILILIHNNNYELDITKLEINKFVDQITKQLTFQIYHVMHIIQEYIIKYKILVTQSVLSAQSVQSAQSAQLDLTTDKDKDKDEFLKLVTDENFKFRLYDNIHVRKNKLKLLDNNEKTLLIKCLRKVMKVELLTEIEKFIINPAYVINLINLLNENQILLIKYIITSKYIFINDFDVKYAFIEFLYKNYNTLFTNNKIYENLRLLI
jgi:hypothetical protein